MARAKILITEPIHDTAVIYLARSFEIDKRYSLTESSLLENIDNYDAIITRSNTAVTQPIINRAKRLKVIGRAGIGIDNIASRYAAEKGIAVVNAPTGNVLAAAEHTLGLIFALLRHIPQADLDLRHGVWGKQVYIGTQLQGKTLGIVGLGRVGSLVAKKAVGLGMRVLACDPFIKPTKDFPIIPLSALLKKADIVSLHVPLTKLTHHLLDKQALSLVKPTSYLINCARGSVVDQLALIEVLSQKKLAGAALDVFEDEPLPKNSPLIKFKNCLLTPHIGGSTHEAQQKTGLEVARKVARILANAKPRTKEGQRVQLVPRQTIDTVIFDCDSTLTAIEGIDELARSNGVIDQVAALTKQAMAGEIPYEEVFRQRLKLTKPSKKQLSKLGEQYVASLLPDTRDVVSALRYLGKNIYIVTGSYDLSLKKLAKYLQLSEEYVLANRLFFDADGNYVDFDTTRPLWKNGGKQITIGNIPKNGERMLLVGDSATDLEARGVVSDFIGFGGFVSREYVKRKSPIFVAYPVLSPILLLATTPAEWGELLASPFKPLIQDALHHTLDPKRVIFKGQHRAIIAQLKNFFQL